MQLGGEKVACSRDAHGKLQCVSAWCTHMGCIVAWNQAEQTWDCPCHGSRFHPDGQVMAGPAESALDPVKPSATNGHAGPRKPKAVKKKA